MTCLVSGLVIAFGKESMLEECVGSLQRALARVPGRSELVIVLNRISDHARRELESARPDAVLVGPPRNLGFAGGVDAGIVEARGEWIVLVNDDCIVEPDALVELLAAARSRDDVGSVAGQVRFAGNPGTINSAGLELDELGVASERLLGAPVASAGTEVAEVFGATGALAAYRRSMLDAAGGFDSSFFAYLEDADLAWRARMLGWRCLYAPGAVAHHHHSATLGHASAAKHFLVGRNRVRMIAKNATTAHLRRRAAAMLAYDFAFVVFVAVRRRTLAPLRGRVRGLREWRAYRAAGEGHRRAVPFAPPGGLRQALRRNRIYSVVSAGDVAGERR